MRGEHLGGRTPLALDLRGALELGSKPSLHRFEALDDLCLVVSGQARDQIPVGLRPVLRDIGWLRLCRRGFLDLFGLLDNPTGYRIGSRGLSVVGILGDELAVRAARALA